MSATGVQHGPTSELRQAPEADEWWQDSAFLAWYAPGAGIGGMTRIGHEPNHEGGISALWSGVVTHDGNRFRRNVASPLDDADLRDDGFGAYGGRHQLTYDGTLHYRVEEEGCRVDLEIEDFYARTDFFPPDSGTLVDDFASSHFETSGRVRGSVELAGRTYEVDGLCHRDRSWGIRRWDTLLTHRWIPGTVGPELSFGSISWHGIDGSIRQFGYVVREGELVRAEEVDVAVTLEADGLTYRAGTARWSFADGTGLQVDCEPFDGIVSEHHGVACVDALCAIEVEGRKGFCDLEASNNARGGRGPITAAVRAVTADGVSTR